MNAYFRALLLIVLGSVAFQTAAQTRVADIVSQQQQIRADVQAGKGRYKDMPAGTRNELLLRQAAVLRAVEGKQSTSELAEGDKIRVFNDLEWIEATINQAEDERMVCEMEKTTGSNRKTRVCKTVAQKRKEAEAARNIMSRGTRCADSSCIGN